MTLRAFLKKEKKKIRGGFLWGWRKNVPAMRHMCHTYHNPYTNDDDTLNDACVILVKSKEKKSRQY